MKSRALPKASTAAGSSRQAMSASALAKGAVRGTLPAFVEPCLATLVAKPPEGDDWVHEIKFDGYRIEARLAATASNC